MQTQNIITSRSREFTLVWGHHGERELVLECRRLFAIGYRKIELTSERDNVVALGGQCVLDRALEIHGETGEFPIVYLKPKSSK